MTPSVTQSEVFTALLSVLSTITSLPSGQILQGQQNLVPPPAPADYVIMWPLWRKSLDTNEDGGWIGVANPTAIEVTTSVEFGIQVDVFGPNSGDNAHVIQSLFRDEYVNDLLIATGYNVASLYPDDPRQMPFVDGENQYEQRWSIDLHLMIAPVLSPAMQFANTAKTTIVEID